MANSGVVFTEPKFTPSEHSASNTGKIVEPNLYGIGTNYATANKWFGFLPLENVLGPRYKNIDLHLTRFSIPQIQCGSMEVAFRGYKKQIPNKLIDSETKQLTLEYLVDEDWNNYRQLYLWMNSLIGNINQMVEEEATTITASQYVPLRIYLLDNYKRRTMSFLFTDCWISVFNELALDVNSPQQITHSFTFYYSQMKLENLQDPQ